MFSLSAPVGAARSFFTPPTVTPVDGPASWFAAQRTATTATGAARSAGTAPASGFAIEEFDLGGDADLDALEERDAAGAGRDRRTTRGTGA